MFENGKYREMTKKDTEGSWALAILLSIIVMAPIWLLWKVLEYFFNLIFVNNKEKKQ